MCEWILTSLVHPYILTNIHEQQLEQLKGSQPRGPVHTRPKATQKCRIGLRHVWYIPDGMVLRELVNGGGVNISGPYTILTQVHEQPLTQQPLYVKNIYRLLSGH